MIWATIGGWVGVIVLGFWLLQAHQKIGAEREQCNTRIETASRERVEKALDAMNEAHSDELDRIERRLQKERDARDIAERARVEAENQPIRVRTIIKEVIASDPQSCLTERVPVAILDELRQ